MQSCFMCERDPTELHSFVRDILSNRPPPKRFYDQFGLTEKSLIKESLLIVKYVDTEHKIGILGGFDGLGLVLSFIGFDIIVLEKDDDVIKWYVDMAKKHGLKKLNIIKYDATKPITEEIMDVTSNVSAWRTDPPYNCGGMKLFIDRISYIIYSNNPEKTYSVFFAVPAGYGWGYYVQTNIYNYVKNELGFNIIFLPYLFDYSNIEGMKSARWLLKPTKKNIRNLTNFNTAVSIDIYSPTPETCWEKFRCEVFHDCISLRREWLIMKRLLRGGEF